MKKRICFWAVLSVLCTCILGMASLNAGAAEEENHWKNKMYRSADNNICIDFEEVRVMLPAWWSGNCQIVTSSDEVAFYQTKSRELYTQQLGYPAGGWMFSINYTQDFDFLDWPDYQTIGFGKDGIYYASFPTDVQVFSEDEEAYNEYKVMIEDMIWIRNNLSMLNDSAEPDSALRSEYIFPQSSMEYLSEKDLSGMSVDQVQMAINEIYARHHRKFVMQNVQDYFNSKSWYEGYIEAEDFDVSVMNVYESANIDLMVKYMDRLNNNEQNILVLPNATKDASGTIIEAGSDYFRIRLEDSSSIQFWYDPSRLSAIGVYQEMLQPGATVKVVYDEESYEALNVLVW